MSSFQQFVEQTRSNLVSNGFNESDTKRMTKEILDICLKEQNRCKNIRLEFLPTQVICSIDDNCIGIVKSTEATNMARVMIKKEEIERLLKHMPEFIKSDEEMLFNHTGANEYMMGSISEITREMNRQMELKEENIKLFKYRSKKYYRLTYTPKDRSISCSLSRIEFAFGHLIDGYTYIIEKDLYRLNKAKFL